MSFLRKISLSNLKTVSKVMTKDKDTVIVACTRLSVTLSSVLRYVGCSITTTTTATTI